MRDAFNTVCFGCKTLQPRCVMVRFLAQLSSQRPAPLCELCRKLPEFKGRFRVDERHKGK